MTFIDFYLLSREILLHGESETELSAPGISGHAHRFCAIARCLIDQAAPDCLSRFFREETCS